MIGFLIIAVLLGFMVLLVAHITAPDTISCPYCVGGIKTIRASDDPTSRIIARENCWVCGGTGQRPKRRR